MSQKQRSRRIVAHFRDKHGNDVALYAQHGLQWRVYKDIDGRIEIISMPRKRAQQEYDKLRKIYEPKKRRHNS